MTTIETNMQLVEEYSRRVAHITIRYDATKLSFSASDYRAYCAELKPYWDELVARIKEGRNENRNNQA